MVSNKKRIPVMIFHLFKHPHQPFSGEVASCLPVSLLAFLSVSVVGTDSTLSGEGKLKQLIPLTEKKDKKNDGGLFLGFRITAIFLILASWRDPKAQKAQQVVSYSVKKAMSSPPDTKEQAQKVYPIKIYNCHPAYFS